MMVLDSQELNAGGLKLISIFCRLVFRMQVVRDDFWILPEELFRMPLKSCQVVGITQIRV